MNETIFTFPLEQIGWALRRLSLSGAMGNMIAIILYVLIGLIPCMVWLFLKGKGKNLKEDYLLFPISGFLLLVLYYMINPGLIPVNEAGGGKLLLAGTFYSVLVGYVVLRILKLASLAGIKSLQKGLQILLYGVILIFAFMVGIELLVNLPKSIAAIMEAGNEFMYFDQVTDVNLTLTCIFLILRSVVYVLPYVLDGFLLFAGAKAIDRLLADAYSDEAVDAVRKIGSYCRKNLGIVVISSALFNVLQLIFAKYLQQVQITTTIPVFSILFVIGILVVARFVEENQKLKQDNDLFI